MVGQITLEAVDLVEMPSAVDTSCQETLLPGVSRTFALTIPQLPKPLRVTVTNAYLLCRIADTVEDDGGIDHDEKCRLQKCLLQVIGSTLDAEQFTQPCLRQLSQCTPATERELIHHTAEIVAVTHSFSLSQRSVIERCLQIMCDGMSEFARERSLRGLPSLSHLDRYCYVVAGCVGEMLTELFCEYSPEIAAQRSRMLPLAQAFGQGLQLTNILKDVWDDQKHNACWLPRDVFAAHGLDVSELVSNRSNPAVAQCLDLLIGIAHGHLSAALEYTQLIPKEESGIRNFCLWAIGLAVLTLRNIHRQPDFSSGQEVKVSRRALRGVIATSNLLASSNRALSFAFSLSGFGLPRCTEPFSDPCMPGNQS